MLNCSNDALLLVCQEEILGLYLVEHPNTHTLSFSLRVLEDTEMNTPPGVMVTFQSHPSLLFPGWFLFHLFLTALVPEI